ncbi:trypsin-like serine protease [Pseudomonas gingeri]|uniref:trypsin-like serine protease n=1 Tax=Pseudomonas gingeri TaxID=117681 RepID=UPI0015A43644|nr:trypsin-like serine protease [Pseudomonas gingeri]NWA11564.1 trypsin-like serine protease [Pseudomonas gingeri]
MDGYGSRKCGLRLRCRLHDRWPGALFCTAFLTVCGSLPAFAEHGPDLVGAVDKDKPVTFTLPSQTLKNDDIQIFHGAPAQKGDWRSIAISQTDNAGVKSTCTATFIGQHVLLTAAHCVVVGANNFASPITIGPFKYRCTVDRAYLSTTILSSVRHPADYALCVAEPYSGPTPSDFKHLRWDSLDLRAVARNDLLLVAGFGCVSWTFNPSTGNITVHPVEKKLVVGDFKVADLEEDSFSSESDGKTQSALCSGDSGGPAFNGVSVMNPDGARTIRGIASRKVVEDNKVVSHFASLSTSRFRRFLTCWKGDNPDAYLMIQTSDGKPLEGQACAAGTW